MGTRIEAVIFDIIETVFSLRPVGRTLTGCGLDERDLETWFAFGLRDAFALDATEAAKPFPDILRDALRELLAARGVDADATAQDAVMDAFGAMPPQDGAEEAFAMIAEAGLPILALSNGPAARTRSLLEASGLDRHVGTILSVEDVGRFKPQAPVYRHGIDSASKSAEACCMVACHAWDLHGAKAVGMQTAFVRRGQFFPGTMSAPDLEGDELVDVAKAILSRAG